MTVNGASASEALTSSNNINNRRGASGSSRNGATGSGPNGSYSYTGNSNPYNFNTKNSVNPSNTTRYSRTNNIGNASNISRNNIGNSNFFSNMNSQIIDKNRNLGKKQDVLTYAQKTSAGPIRTTVLAKDDKIDLKELTRCYKLKRLPPVGFQSYVQKLFPTLDMCSIAQIEYRKVFMPSLTLHFDKKEDPVQAQKDYDKAESFMIYIGKSPVTLTAENDDGTDGMGNIVPRVVKNIFAKNISYALSQNPEYIREALKDYADIDVDKISNCKENRIFNGNIVIPVTDYKKIPMVYFDMPHVVWDITTQKFIKVEGATVKAEIRCRGFDPTKIEKVTEKTKFCSFCKKEGHWTNKCQLKPEFKFHCYQCGSKNGDCERDNCKNFESMMDTGVFKPKSQLLPKKARKQQTMIDNESRYEKYTLVNGNYVKKKLKRPRNDYSGNWEKTSIHNKFGILNLSIDNETSSRRELENHNNDTPIKDIEISESSVSTVKGKELEKVVEVSESTNDRTKKLDNDESANAELGDNNATIQPEKQTEANVNQENTENLNKENDNSMKTDDDKNMDDNSNEQNSNQPAGK